MHHNLQIHEAHEEQAEHDQDESRDDPEAQPDFVVQYFTSNRPVGFIDPRQHAITLAFVIPITGKIAAMGEAQSFRWFDLTNLRPANEWGFEQNIVVQKCVESWLAR